MKRINKKFYSFIMLVLLIFNVFVPRNIVSVEANEISRVSLTDGVIVDIAAGTDHNLALDQQGNLWAWGRNDYGQIGNGTTIDQPTPVQIMRGHKFKKISAGNNISAAIDVDGYLYVWGGSNNFVNNNNVNPVLIEQGIFKDVKCDYNYIRTIDNKSSNNNLCGYFSFSSSYQEYTNDRDLFVGFSNSKKTINVWDTTLTSQHKRSSSSSGFSYTSDYWYFYNDLKTIEGDENFVSFDGVFANTINQKRYSYYAGSDTYYMPQIKMCYAYIDYLGKIIFLDYKINSGENSYTSTSGCFFDEGFNVNSLEDKNFINLSFSKNINNNQLTIYFVSYSGKIYSVGNNGGSNNLLGSGDSVLLSDSSTPIEVQSDAKFTKASAGLNHVLALDENGKVYSWGNNAYGQLGHDDTNIRTIPTMIKTFNETKSFNFNAFSNEVFTDTFYQNGGSNYTLVETGSKGTFNIDKDSGEFTYTPNENEYGEDTAVISISYSGVVVNYQVNVYIDRKPVFTGGTPSFNVECGESYTGVAPAIDPDNDNLTYSIINQPLKGEVVLNNNAGSFTYTASTELAGNDSFTIGVSDGYCVVEYPVNVHIQSLISYDDETIINIDLLRNNAYSSNINAKDIDGDSLSYSISKLPVKGNITIDNEGNYTYTADGDKYGEDTFTIKIDDGYKPLEVKYTVNLFAVSDDGTTLAKTITQGSTYSDVIKTNANGVSPIYSIKAQPKNGNIVIDAEAGEYTYTPNVGSVGEDSFEVLVDFTYGQYVLTIHIYQNTIPSDSNVSLDIITNENVNYIGSAACVDIDGDALAYSIKTKPSKGSVSINPTTGEYTYYPNKDVAGDDSFEILVNDGTDSIIININVHIESLIVTEKTINKTISQNTSLSSEINASDKDGDTLRYSIDSNPSNGIANIDSLTGEYIYIPFNNYYGSDSFIIKVDDGVKAELVTINIKVNRRPISDQITINLETNGITVTGSAECSDPDGDTLIYSIDSNPAQGSVIINESTGAFAYTPNSNAAGNDTFTIKATDGCDDIIITVVVHNETELNIDTSNNTIVVNQGKSTTGQVEVIDEDGDTLTYSIVNYPTQGTINLNEHTGAWTYNALKNAKGTDTFTISVTDGNTTKTITYTLLINTPAEFNSNVDTNLTTNVNENYTGKVEASDEDGDSLTYTIVSQGNKGTVSIDSSSGRYIYVPNENTAGDDTFVIGVSDGNFVTEIEIHIHIESDIEIENSILNSEVDKGSITTGKVEATDKDGDSLTYSIYQQGEKGTANVTNDGNWSYFAGEGAGNDSFVIAISDGTHTEYVTVYVHISTKPIFEENNITINVSEGSSTNGKVNGSDEDGDTLTYEVTSQPENGTLNLNSQTGEYTYTVFSNSEASEDVFIITVSDGENTSSITVRVIINNAPEVEDSTITINQDGSGNGTIEVEDPEGDNISYTVGTQGNKGTVSINSSTGEYTYTTTDKNYSGTDTFTIVVSDGYNTQEVVVTVIIINNEAPTVSNESISVNQDGSGNGTIEVEDPEGDNISYTVGTQGNKGTVSINSSTGEYTYTTTDKNYSGTDTFTIVVSDGYNTQEVVVTVNIVKNTKPSANETTVELESDSTVSGKINGLDSEDDELTYSISYQGDKGTAVINESTGEFTYTSYKDTEGYDCFVVTISDGYNEVSYLVEVNITFVDSNNSWAIPTTIATGTISIGSLASLLFVLLKKKKTM